MKKLFLFTLALFLVACTPNVEINIETFETDTSEEIIDETVESIKETDSEIKEERLTKDELILADIAKAEVEYYGLEKYYSRARIFNMLTSNVDTNQKISEKVANYAINKANIDFKKNALSTAAIYAYDNWWDWEYIEKTLKDDDLFTEEEVKYAMDNLDDVDY